MDAKVDESKITDRELAELFNCVETGSSKDGFISKEEFRLFLAAKRDMKKLPGSGKLAVEPSSLSARDQENKPRSDSVACMVVEYVCVKRAAIRQSRDVSSPVSTLGAHPIFDHAR